MKVFLDSVVDSSFRNINVLDKVCTRCTLVCIQCMCVLYGFIVQYVA